jgi:Flp pilus assembly protein TadG
VATARSFAGGEIRLKTRQRRLQEGQAIVLIALLILVLFAMLGLAIDSGRAYVDRRDQQSAIDAAALAAGDWYENYQVVRGTANSSVPQAALIYQTNLHLYGGWSSDVHTFAKVGVTGQLNQDTDVFTYPGGYVMTVVATDTQFNGYQFTLSSTHNLPLAFMQIFGGPTTVTINATATAIVGNQRQTPALLTLSNGACATQLQGAGTLTVLGDVYTNGTACLDSNMNEAGNCYGAAGSNCSVAQFDCYNSDPGFIPYAPNPSCNAGDIQGSAIVPAPTLPDPGYLAPSQPYYTAAGLQFSRGGYTEMTPGIYNNFSISGGGCYFLDPGVYTWNGGYTSHGGLTSNELKAPNEESYSAPGTTSAAVTDFWGGCAGSFTTSVVAAASPNGMKHQGGGGQWGIELTSVRFDTFIDPGIAPNPCFASPGCRRESTPSRCVLASTIDASNQGININITQNSPGAQYYLAYINPNGCDGNPNNFSFVGRYLAPGWTDGGAPPASAAGAPWTGTLKNGQGGWNGTVATVSICAIAYNSLSPNNLCFAQARAQLCQPPDDETAPQCFANCPPAASVPQSNPDMELQYPPYTGGDIANENYCVVSPNPGLPLTPCTTAKVTPGAVQFYFAGGSNCLDQNGNGSTHVFSGEQYNWIVIYQVAGNTCSYQNLNGNAETQYIGTIYSPSASWDILGSDTSPLAGQVICFAAKVTGSANVGIDFNPNYSPAPPAARLIN